MTRYGINEYNDERPQDSLERLHLPCSDGRVKRLETCLLNCRLDGEAYPIPR